MQWQPTPGANTSLHSTSARLPQRDEVCLVCKEWAMCGHVQLTWWGAGGWVLLSCTSL